MKLLNLVIKPSGGGAEKVVALIQQELKLKGVDVSTVSCLADGATFDLQMHLSNKDGFIQKLIIIPLKLARYLFLSKPDIIHLHCERPEFSYALASFMIPKSRRPMLCITEHTTQPWVNFPILGKFVRYRLNSLNAHWVSCFPTAGMDFIPNPVSVVEKLSPVTGPLRFVFVGRLIKSKCVDELIKAHINSGTDKELVIIGDGPDRDRLGEISGHDPKIKFLGYQTSPWSHVRKSDLFVTCSAQEGMPLAVLEALALGLPILASNIPPHRMILSPNSIFPTPQDLVTALKKPEEVVSRALMDNKSETSTSLVRSPREISGIWLGYYTKLLKGHLT